jgi:hypothetical protein
MTSRRCGSRDEIYLLTVGWNMLELTKMSKRVIQKEQGD